MRIGSSLFGADLIAQNNLMRAFGQLSETNVRLSTMQRINRGSDDPAGLIAVGQLQAELVALEALDSSAERMSGAIQVADSAMAQVGDLLNTIRGDIVEAAGGTLSDAEVAAKQMEIDAALGAINRIGSSTAFGGRNLLDGTYTMTLGSASGTGGGTSLSLAAISTAALGGSAGSLSDLASGASASLTAGDPAKAAEILNAAQDQVLQARAQAASFERYTIQSTRQVAASTEETLTAALSSIYDTDVAAEVSRQVRAQLLITTGVASLLSQGRSRGMIGQLLAQS